MNLKATFMLCKKIEAKLQSYLKNKKLGDCLPKNKVSNTHKFPTSCTSTTCMQNPTIPTALTAQSRVPGCYWLGIFPGLVVVKPTFGVGGAGCVSYKHHPR